MKPNMETSSYVSETTQGEGGVQNHRLEVADYADTSKNIREHLRIFRTEAERKKIQPIEGGLFMVVDGIEYRQFGSETSETSRVDVNTDGYNISCRRVDQVGTFDSNNSTVAFVDETGVMRVGHATDENYEALQKAGYRRGKIWVPFSNGEVPTDPELRKLYVNMRERGRELNKQRNIREHLRIFRTEAERKKIQPIEGGLFMVVDGIEYRQFGSETSRVDVNTDGYNMSGRRVDQVGTFNGNNGILAFVDEKGRMWVGASTSENYEALQKAGYRRGGIWVPFSNSEVPTDEDTRRQLRDVLTGKKADQLKAEREARVEEIISGRRDLFGDVAVIPDRQMLLERVADRAERDYIRTEALVGEKLEPSVEEDDGGFPRKIFSLNGITFSFRGREELPVYPTLKRSRARLLGEVPRWVEEADYQSYIQQVQNIAEGEVFNEQEHIIVDKTLYGVVGLAIALGSQDTTLQVLRDELSQGVFSERSLLLVDGLVALNYMGFSGFSGSPSCDAEAVLVLALLGDSQAQTAVAEAVDTLRRHDQLVAVNTERWESDEQPLRPQDLCVVHATRYKPEETETGFSVSTTFDATKGKVLRNTVHTALNHEVAGHMYGSWGDAGYVIVSPFASMMRDNGVPTVLNTVDTYWATDPGEPVRFPDATLIAPGGSDIKGLYEVEGNTIRFKSKDFDIADLRLLSDYARERGYLDEFSGRVDSAVIDSLGQYGTVTKDLGEQWDFDVVRVAINQHLYGDDNAWGHQPALLDALTRLNEGEQGVDLEARLRLVIEESGATKGIRPETQDIGSETAKLASALADRIRATMFTEINELAVRAAIERAGFTVHSGGMWASGDSGSVTRRTGLLGQELGTRVGAHTNMPDHELTERFIRSVRGATTEETEGSKFDWKKFALSFDDLLPRLDPKTRRVIYTSGLLTARS